MLLHQTACRSTNSAFRGLWKGGYPWLREVRLDRPMRLHGLTASPFYIPSRDSEFPFMIQAGSVVRTFISALLHYGLKHKLDLNQHTMDCTPCTLPRLFQPLSLRSFRSLSAWCLRGWSWCSINLLRGVPSSLCYPSSRGIEPQLSCSLSHAELFIGGGVYPTRWSCLLPSPCYRFKLKAS